MLEGNNLGENLAMGFMDKGIFRLLFYKMGIITMQRVHLRIGKWLERLGIGWI